MRGKSRAMFLTPYICLSDFAGSYAVILIFGELCRLIGLVSKSVRVQCDVPHVLSFPGPATKISQLNAGLRLRD